MSKNDVTLVTNAGQGGERDRLVFKIYDVRGHSNNT
jgi:hypothetical protein